MNADPYEIECRQRDADKGHSPAGITMTQSEWDRRYLLGLLDRERSVYAELVEAALDAVGQVDQDPDYCFGCHDPRPCVHDSLRMLLPSDQPKPNALTLEEIRKQDLEDEYELGLL